MYTKQSLFSRLILIHEARLQSIQLFMLRVKQRANGHLVFGNSLPWIEHESPVLEAEFELRGHSRRFWGEPAQTTKHGPGNR